MKSVIGIIGTVVLTSVQAFAACPAGTTDLSTLVDGKPACSLKGSYLNSNITLNAGNSYVLEGDVRIGGDKSDSSTLTIDPGVTVYGATGSFLVISRDSKIFAQGSANQPIVFTSLERQNPVPGLWGGIVITGNARINNCKGAVQSCDNTVEGVQTNPPKFGGENDDDNSGVLSYVRSEYAGFTIAPDNELNAITFYAVGRGTQVDHIEAYKGADDGIEIFGGTVDLKYVASIDNDDDGFDWDMGWTGHAQFVYIEVENATEADPNGIEADNLKSPMNAMPRSNPTLSNVTVTAKPGNPKILNGIMLRRGTGAKFYNTIVKGAFQSCLNIDDEETFVNGGTVNNGVVEQTGIVMENTIVNCDNGVNFAVDAKDVWSIESFFNQPTLNNYVMNPELKGYMPEDGGPAVDTGITPPVLKGTWQFTPVDYVGAFSQFDDEDWTQGWVVK
jgi:hypothetical protein